MLSHAVAGAALAPTVLPQGRTPADGSGSIRTSNGGDAHASSSAPATTSAPGSGLRAGMQLGTTAAGDRVVVLRELGSPRGYDDRWQAVSVARMSGATHAAVAQGADGRWHAVETSATFHRTGFVANDTPIRALYGLPSNAAIRAQQAQVTSLQSELRALDGKRSPGHERAVDTRRSELLRDLSQAQTLLASLVLGVDADELQFNAHSSGRSAGMVNVTGQPGRGSSGGAHGPVAHQGGMAFRPGLKTAIEIDLPQLDRPVRAQATLFHETTHLRDHQLAQAIVRRFETETGARFDGDSVVSQRRLDTWLAREVAQHRLGAADAELTSDEAAGRTSTTEARANVRTVVAALQAGAATDGHELLVAYAKALPPVGRQYGSPPPGSAVVKELVADAKAEYRRMTLDQRVAWDRAVAAATAANPDAWISQLRFRAS